MAMNNSLAEVHPELVSEWSDNSLAEVHPELGFRSGEVIEKFGLPLGQWSEKRYR